MYQKGWGTQQSYAEAVRWFLKAADQGHAAAQYNLGVMYDRGWGVTQDYAQAKKWYRKAADPRDADAGRSLSLFEIHPKPNSTEPVGQVLPISPDFRRPAQPVARPLAPPAVTVARIRFACGSCSRIFDVPDNQAGVTMWCPQCQSELVVPMQYPPQPPVPLPVPPAATPVTVPTPRQKPQPGGSSALGITCGLAVSLIVCLFCVIGAVSFLTGSGDSSGSLATLKTTPDLKGRLEAAFAVQSSYTRDELLEKIAEDASSQGEVDVVKIALGKHSSQYERDQLAEKIALRLAKKGKAQGATEIARMISSSYTRDQVLEKIAKGSGKGQ